MWYFVPRRRPRLSHKWQLFYEGPFLVVHQPGAVNVEMQKTERSKNIVVHVEKLKICNVPGLNSWLPVANLRPSQPAASNVEGQPTANLQGQPAATSTLGNFVPTCQAVAGNVEGQVTANVQGQPAATTTLGNFVPTG